MQDQKSATNMDALIKDWQDNVRELAETRIISTSNTFYGDFEGYVHIKRGKPGYATKRMEAYEEAIRKEVEWLLSPAGSKVI